MSDSEREQSLSLKVDIVGVQDKSPAISALPISALPISALPISALPSALLKPSELGAGTQAPSTPRMPQQERRKERKQKREKGEDGERRHKKKGHRRHKDKKRDSKTADDAAVPEELPHIDQAHDQQQQLTDMEVPVTAEPNSAESNSAAAPTANNLDNADGTPPVPVAASSKSKTQEGSIRLPAMDPSKSKKKRKQRRHTLSKKQGLKVSAVSAARDKKSRRKKERDGNAKPNQMMTQVSSRLTRQNSVKAFYKYGAVLLQILYRLRLAKRKQYETKLKKQIMIERKKIQKLTSVSSSKGGSKNAAATARTKEAKDAAKREAVREKKAGRHLNARERREEEEVPEDEEALALAEEFAEKKAAQEAERAALQKKQREHEEILVIPAKEHGAGSVLFDWTSDGEYLASAGFNLMVNVWDVEGDLYHSFKMEGDRSDPIRALAWDASNTYLACLQAGTSGVVIYNVKKNKRKTFVLRDCEEETVVRIAWSNINPILTNTLAVCTAEGSVVIFDMNDLNQITVDPLKQSLMDKMRKISSQPSITCLAWTNEGFNKMCFGTKTKKLAVCDNEGQIEFETDLPMMPVACLFVRDESVTHDVVAVNLNHETVFIARSDDYKDSSEMQFPFKHGHIVDMESMGGGFLMLGFSTGYVTVVATCRDNVGQEWMSIETGEWVGELRSLTYNPYLNWAAVGGNRGVAIVEMGDQADTHGLWKPHVIARVRNDDLTEVIGESESQAEQQQEIDLMCDTRRIQWDVLLIDVIKARHLRTSYPKADTFVSIRCGDFEASTTVEERSDEPNWTEQLFLVVPSVWSKGEKKMKAAMLGKKLEVQRVSEKEALTLKKIEKFQALFGLKKDDIGNLKRATMKKISRRSLNKKSIKKMTIGMAAWAKARKAVLKHLDQRKADELAEQKRQNKSGGLLSSMTGLQSFVGSFRSGGSKSPRSPGGLFGRFGKSSSNLNAPGGGMSPATPKGGKITNWGNLLAALPGLNQKRKDDLESDSNSDSDEEEIQYPVDDYSFLTVAVNESQHSNTNEKHEVGYMELDIDSIPSMTAHQWTAQNDAKGKIGAKPSTPLTALGVPGKGPVPPKSPRSPKGRKNKKPKHFLRGTWDLYDAKGSVTLVLRRAKIKNRELRLLLSNMFEKEQQPLTRDIMSKYNMNADIMLGLKSMRAMARWPIKCKWAPDADMLTIATNDGSVHNFVFNETND